MNGLSWYAYFEVGDSTFKSTGVSPNSVSPVLRTELTIQVESDEDMAALGAENYSIKLTSREDSSKDVILAVYAIDAVE